MDDNMWEAKITKNSNRDSATISFAKADTPNESSPAIKEDSYLKIPREWGMEKHEYGSGLAPTQPPLSTSSSNKMSETMRRWFRQLDDTAPYVAISEVKELDNKSSNSSSSCMKLSISSQSEANATDGTTEVKHKRSQNGARQEGIWRLGSMDD
jgi:hypothetical protein